MSIIHLSQKGGGVDLRTILSTNITSTTKLLSLMEPSFYVECPLGNPINRTELPTPELTSQRKRTHLPD